MSLTREATIKKFGFQPGDMKIVNYSIAFTAQQLVEPETGWFLLNGAAISQTTYPILYAKYGTLFNDGTQGAGNFRLPNLTDGVVPVCKGVTNFTSYGTSGGEINHTLTTTEMPGHTHTDNFSVTVGSHGHTGSASISAAASSHTHTYTGVYLVNTLGSSGALVNDFNNQTAAGTTSNNTGHGHSTSASVGNTTSSNLNVSGSIAASGSGGSHNNMSPYQVWGGWLVKHD